MQVLYEDNHLIIVNKAPGEICQSDRTGDVTLLDAVKQYVKMKYNKPGEVFLGLVHRLDRPVSGVVVFARTSKALARMNELFREHTAIQKTYHAIVLPPQDQTSAAKFSGTSSPNAQSTGPSSPFVTLRHWLTRDRDLNKAYAHPRPVPGAKEAYLEYRTIGWSQTYNLLEIKLHTGRHHQIRCQLSAIGLPIKGDLKYGARRSNPDGSICLHARTIEFIHPVSKKPIRVEAPYPQSLKLWYAFDLRTEREM